LLVGVLHLANRVYVFHFQGFRLVVYIINYSTCTVMLRLICCIFLNVNLLCLWACPVLKAPTYCRVWGRAFLVNLSLAFYDARRLIQTQDLEDTNGDILPLLQPPGLPFYVSNDTLTISICIFMCELHVYLYLASNIFASKRI
jgi:hypothetical protein